jgi:hypothetical protein
VARLIRMGNADLRRDRIWTWSLPAWVTRLPDGRAVNVCPSAMACSKVCYARKGTYRFSNVKAAHQRNLAYVLDDPDGWQAEITREVQALGPDTHVRIHDGGDFLSEDYLARWLEVVRAAPHVTFYCYTKEIPLFRRLVEPDPPANFRWVYSYGGRWDHLIRDTDRRADVFPTREALDAAGFHDQEDSDLLAIYGPLAVGIVVNNHPGAVKGMGGKSLGGT